MATLAELGSVYGLQDMWDMLEVLAVDAYNEQCAQDMSAQRQQANGKRN